MGLLYLFIALWIMSIFGNYGDIERWERVKQIELFRSLQRATTTRLYASQSAFRFSPFDCICLCGVVSS